MSFLLFFSPANVVQDPDVINTPLPVEHGPTVDEESSTVIRPVASDRMTPLLVSRSLDMPVQPAIFTTLPQVQKPQLLLQWPPQTPQEVAIHEALEPFWAEPPSAPGACSSSWLQVPEHQPSSSFSSSSGSHKLKNNTKNLWNPTYGSWILESFGRTTLSHAQSVPLSSTTMATSHFTSTVEHNDSGTGVSLCSNSSPAPSQVSSSSPGPSSLTSRKGPAGASGGSLVAVMDLAKLQSFPCGNVNYAYDEQTYEAESLPLVVARSPKASSSSATSSSLTALGLAFSVTHKPLVKRHASYGHEDVRRHTKPEKPIRDRDSGFSLSEDLSVTPV